MGQQVVVDEASDRIDDVFANPIVKPAAPLILALFR